MADSAQAPRPKVDDAYWFAVSEDLVTKSLGAHEAAAAKLQKLVVWLWGIYTTYAAVGIALAGKSLPLWAALLIALASAALIGVYWGTFWVQAPVAKYEFDPRSPDDIRYAFTGILEEKRRRFNLTLAGSVIAASMVVVALVIASTVKSEPAGVPGLRVVLVKSDASKELSLVATVDKGAIAQVRVEPEPATSGHPGTVRTIVSTAEGLVQGSVPLDPSVDKARVSVEWPCKDGMTCTMSRKIATK
jgi:hypothetical protein